MDMETKMLNQSATDPISIRFQIISLLRIGIIIDNKIKNT